uniref:Uncharacterized protein n=1 Tax=Arundo donax TaxID=35708 RepID=A0A0A9AZS3_ARUDO
MDPYMCRHYFSSLDVLLFSCTRFSGIWT